MARRLPSLNGLRALEAAGRHGSFTAAAQELSVTQAAVRLTAQGQALLSGVTDSFDSIARLADQVAAMRAGPCSRSASDRPWRSAG